MSQQAQNASLAILSELIGFATVSKDSNLGLIEWVRDYLKRHGVSSELIYDASKAKANLWATLGSPGDNGIILSGHTDVVPTAGQAWDSHPFKARVDGDRIFGRGACDMKGFIASVLAQVPSWSNLSLRHPLHLAFSYDEELGCLGVRSLIDLLREKGLRASGCIVGEPTQMKPVVAHKGRLCMRCTVQGRAAHSSLTPNGVNAIEYAARFVAFMHERAKAEAADGARDVGFDVPFSTLAVTTIKGGLANNIIPERCEFELDYRYLPWSNHQKLLDALHAFREELIQEMRLTASEADISLHEQSSVLPLDAKENAELLRVVSALTGAEDVQRVAYGTEAGFFNSLKIPTIVCGPGSIEQAHRPNEYLDLSQLSRCDTFLEQIGQSMSTA